MKHYLQAFVVAGIALVASNASGQGPWAVEPVLVRSGDATEWDEFGDMPHVADWKQDFDSPFTDQTTTLRIHQYDVKQQWVVSLNGKTVGELVRDENPMWVHWELPRGSLNSTGNQLVIKPLKRSGASDDIQLRSIEILKGERANWVEGATLKIDVNGADGPLPCRITITDEAGSLIETGAKSKGPLAVRRGVVYSLTGRAVIAIPPGKYHVHAGRGFEYSLAHQEVQVARGESRVVSLQLRREVATPGYVACDTHVHSRTHSGHGDATVEERMITLAGEGIELPIATDHNVNINHRPFAEKVGADQYFTPVIGNEVTTKWGHFNVFPFPVGAAPPAHQGDDWSAIFRAIHGAPGLKVVILNHARDLHSGYRPFGPSAFNDAAGENLEQWKLQANAMEVINSSAIQTDPLRLFHDWMALLNAGHSITPIGSSDSHDVARHFVGQGRTYIRCDDRDVAAIDVEMASANLAAGRVRVSYGLLVELSIADRWSSGEVAKVGGYETVPLRIRVLAPHWLTANRLALFANGDLVFDERIESDRSQVGVVFDSVREFARPSHDVYLTAIATGQGIKHPYWKTAKPYQPTSTAWKGTVIGCSGAVWLDADGDGRASSARDYAFQSLSHSGPKLNAVLLKRLANYDSATSVQAAYLLDQAGEPVLSDSAVELTSQAAPAVRTGFRRYLEAWRINQRMKMQK